ncbi:abnormal long morphology protein 1-like [Agrilus planipennis]|uniref:Abnormal long morphology protein 1-like n=1 Tax=Agrilus planipennis TaxID=224129 RepID=A0A1W4XLQ0_AGRPL|nr:abnormal long morphology protein 1-like [Agrilus planipennis]
MYYYFNCDASMEYSTNNYSRLFQDLMKLERDYTFNQNQIKLKDEEIERLNLSNGKLQEAIKRKIAEIQTLHCKIFKLESELTETKKDVEKQKVINQKSINCFNQDLQEANKRNESLINQHLRDLKKKEFEMKQHFDSILQEKEYEFKEKLMAAEEKLRFEKQTVTNLTDRLQKQIDDYLQLQDKLRQIEEKYLCEKTAFEQELKSLETIRSNLTSDLITVKDTCLKLEQNMSNSSSEIEKYQADLKHLNEEVKALTDRTDNLTIENKVLKEKLSEASKIYGNALTEAQEWKNKYSEIQLKMTGAESGVCCEIKHQKFDELEKQNAILQDVVKTMRKERVQMELQTQNDISGAESRIERLETLVNLLKKESCYCDNCSEVSGYK